MNRLRIAFLVIPLALGGAACSDQTASGPDGADNNTVTPVPPGMVISNPLSSSANAGAEVGLASIAMSGDSVAYVSLTPQTLPNAANVQIRNRSTSGATTLVPVIQGGFDPVAVAARAGDELILTISMYGGGTSTMSVVVPARHPPTVVRTSPAKGRTDVALNVTVTVVFSEPIDPKTLSATSVRLLHDGNPVSGSVRLSDNAWTAEFVPDKALEPLSSYELVVTQDIRDLDGDSPNALYSVDFTTQESSGVGLVGSYSASVTDTLGIVNGLALHTIWLNLERSGDLLSGTMGIEGWPGGPYSVEGEFNPASSEGTFGTVRLHLGVDAPDFDFFLEAEITKANGSELSGKLIWGDMQSTTPSPDARSTPIVLRGIRPDLIGGIYVGHVTESLTFLNGILLNAIWLRVEQSGNQFSGAFDIQGYPFGPYDIEGEFNPASSKGTFGTVRLHLGVNAPDFDFFLEAEITKADGSELSGKLIWGDMQSITPGPGAHSTPIVLRRF